MLISGILQMIVSYRCIYWCTRCRLPSPPSLVSRTIWRGRFRTRRSLGWASCMCLTWLCVGITQTPCGDSLPFPFAWQMLTMCFHGMYSGVYVCGHVRPSAGSSGQAVERTELQCRRWRPSHRDPEVHWFCCDLHSSSNAVPYHNTCKVTLHFESCSSGSACLQSRLRSRHRVSLSMSMSLIRPSTFNRLDEGVRPLDRLFRIRGQLIPEIERIHVTCALL